MRYAVTGGAGFIGSNLVDRLLADGFAVCAVDNLSTGRIENLHQAHDNTAFSFIEADITHGDTVNLMAQFRPDVIFHLAAQADVQTSVREPTHDAEVNVVGTIAVLGALSIAEYPPVIAAFRARQIPRQVRLNPRPLPIIQPEQTFAHLILATAIPCSRENHNALIRYRP